MAEGDDVEKALRSLQQMLKHHDYSKAGPVIASAKAQLLRARVLIPSLQLQRSKPRAVQLAQEITECGALIAIRRKDAEGFLRYVSQLQEFYNINATLRESGELKGDSRTNESKITGLYLLLLLIQRDNAGYHMALEKLEMAEDGKIYRGDDPFINYPVKMEQWLSEGVYDKVWKATTGHDIPSEEFSLFTDILHNTIRTEIASCAVKSYPSLKVSHAKTMLFLASDKEATDFAHAQGWTLRDGRMYFPKQEEERSEKDILVASGSVIENTIGYTRNLEQIV